MIALSTQRNEVALKKKTAGRTCVYRVYRSFTKESTGDIITRKKLRLFSWL